MRNRFFLIAAAITVTSIFACNNTDGFKKTDSGLEYKIISAGTGDSVLKIDDIAELQITYSTMNDSLLFNSKDMSPKFRLKIQKPEHLGGSLNDGLVLLREGDSAQFLISADSFFIKTRNMKTPDFIKPGEKLKFNVKVIAKTSELEIAAENQKLIEEKKLEEQKLISDYIAANNITVEPTESGLYIIPIEKGKGKQIVEGQTAVVHYTGTLTNGQVFDSSVQRDKPFEFALGKKMVIPAWDEAVATMRVGDKIKILAPSNLAYGSRGAGQTIPPYSPLVFEIKLLEAKIVKAE